ncbi:unnamed protein product, partial [Ixodes pacificus]
MPFLRTSAVPLKRPSPRKPRRTRRERTQEEMRRAVSGESAVRIGSSSIAASGPARKPGSRPRRRPVPISDGPRFHVRPRPLLGCCDLSRAAAPGRAPSSLAQGAPRARCSGPPESGLPGGRRLSMAVAWNLVDCEPRSS